MLHSYGVLLGVAIVAGTALARRNARRLGLPPGRALAVIAAVILVAFWGARLPWLLVHGSEGGFLAELLDPRGGRFYAAGAVAGGLLAGVCLSRLTRLPVLRFTDAVAPGIALGLALGRLGCLLGGCDFGAPTDAGLGLRFPAGSPAFRQQVAEGLLPPDAAASMPVHPTQLYEFAACLALGWLLQRRLALEKRAGSNLAWFLAGYAALRLATESLRGDPARGDWAGLSPTGWLAAAFLAAAAVLFLGLRKATAASPAPARR